MLGLLAYKLCMPIFCTFSFSHACLLFDFCSLQPKMSRFATAIFFLGLAIAMGHYGNPFKGGCESDERPVQVQGIPGAMCTPPCSGGTCPSDVPANCSATPQCALKDTQGHQYCCLICDPSAKSCPMGASCKPLPNGFGLCTYNEGQFLNATNVAVLPGVKL